MDFSKAAGVAAILILPSTRQNASDALSEKESWKGCEPVRVHRKTFIHGDSRDLRDDVGYVPPRVLSPLVDALCWAQEHCQLMLSGDSQLSVECSFIVAISSLLYLAVSFAFLKQNCVLLAVMFLLVTITSLFSDSLCSGSRFWCATDRIVATMCAIWCPGRAIAFYAEDCFHALQITSLSFFSVSFLAWSRKSTTQSQYVLRHTCWHLVSSASLVWLACSVEF